MMSPPSTGGSGNVRERFAASQAGRAAPRSEAELYHMLRTDPPHGRLSYDIRFQIDGDGVWRLSSF